MADARVEREQSRSIEFWNVERRIIGIDVFTRLDSLQEIQSIIDQRVHPFGLTFEIPSFEFVRVLRGTFGVKAVLGIEWIEASV